MSAVAERMSQTPTFRDDLTPNSGLALRRWTPDEFRRMASPQIFDPEEGLELIAGEIFMQDAPVPRLFIREEYYRLAELGILKPDERTELIYGKVIERLNPGRRPHSISLMKSARALAITFGDGYDIE